MNFKIESLAAVVLLVLGVVLFVAALVVLKVLLSRKKPLTSAYGLFGIAVVMIGFSTIRSVTFPGGGGFTKTVGEFEANPNDPKAIAALSKKLDRQIGSTNAPSLSLSEKAGLSRTVTTLAQRTNLSAESRVALSKAQFVLGLTNEARVTVESALASKPVLSNSPQIKPLMKRLR